MIMRLKSLTAIIFILLFFTAPASTKDDESVMKDLTAVIMLNGMPCGKVVAFIRQSESDYIASCQDENRYRIFVNAEGRLVVEKNKKKEEKK